MTEFDILTTAARGMDVQRTMLDLAARNVAAAQASTPGHAYPRLVAHLTGEAESDETPAGLRIEREAGSGDALTELIAVLDAQRAYEAGASVFDAGKRLAERTLDIGRG